VEKSIEPWLSELFPTPKGIPLEFSFLFFSLLGKRKKGLEDIVWALVLLRTYMSSGPWHYPHWLLVKDISHLLLN